ncbi:MAG: RHS repeat-associated core domain-containing protein, partial [Nitrospirota bacterium]
DEPLSLTTDSGTYYYHADGLGTITALTDSDQNVVQKYDYDAFGNLHDEKNAVKQPYTYSGREWDKEIKLYYYRARYYDAKVGRFLSKDPFPGVLTESQTLNGYPYVGNNPINHTDPLGLFDWGNPIDYWIDFFGGTGDFIENYLKMREVNWKEKGTDKYFHCKANCEASQRGLGGQDAACLISDTREKWDQYVKGYPASDSAEDQVANQYGRSQGATNPSSSCAQLCAPFRPSDLPPQY